MDGIKSLMETKRAFLADGGIETWLFFVEEFEAPEFAALLLMDDVRARDAIRAYFDRFLALAETKSTGFVLDTNTWRACTEWAPKLSISEADVLRLTRDAVTFAKEIRSDWIGKVSPILLNGVVGPAGDGYDATGAPDAAAGQRMHTPQIDVMAQEGVDMISAITMTNSGEAIGVARAVRRHGIPCVVSFTTETDGLLPSGETLQEAIEATDAATGNAPIYYMINCAHPDHFSSVLNGDASWKHRIGGVRANASRLSHAELDQSTELDEGDPDEFGRLYSELSKKLPALRVFGGCCGSDHRHIDCASHHLH